MKVRLILLGSMDYHQPLIDAAVSRGFVDFATAIASADLETANEVIDTAIAANESIIFSKGYMETADYMRIFLKRKDLTQGKYLSLCLMFTPAETSCMHKVQPSFMVTDVGLNIAPNAEDKVKITRNAIELHKQLFETEPKVSILTAAGKFNPKIQSSVDGQYVIDNMPDVDIKLDQLDTALSTNAASIKCRAGGVSNILIASDIDCGNAVYKACTTLACYVSGGIIVGGRFPICVNSRSDSLASKLKSIEYARKLLSKS
ncbi:hypothetical protein FACS18945_2840 [Bacteroidia bacterium]|nr:hypothetical protein FACS18945_2840 [Bacteroidia bacterium]